MSAFASASATGADADAVVEACARELDGRVADHDLGLLYVTDLLAPSLPGMLEGLRARTGIEAWSGAVGIGICASGIEYWGQPAASVLTGSFGASRFRLLDSRGPMLAGVAGVLDEWRDRANPVFGLLHLDPRVEAPAETVAALSAWMPDGFLVGGLVSARQLSGDLLSPGAAGGMGGVLFAGDVAVSTRLTQGCSPIGPRHRITVADRNVLVELDGRPALEVFREDIGEVLSRDMTRIAGYIFAGLPVAHSDTGDYLVRNLLGVDPQRGLLAIGEIVEPGAEVLFCRRDAATAHEDMRRMLAVLQSGLGDRQPRAGLYVSCLARGPALFGSESAELGLIAETFGDLPLAGFFANGEISHDRLYAYTGVLSLFL